MKKYCYDYPRPSVTADVIVRCKQGILLIKRNNKKEAFYNCWALPGGYMDESDANLEETAKRELKEETGYDIKVLWQFGVYSDVNRDPRGRVVTAVFKTILENDDDYKKFERDESEVSEMKWFNVFDLPDLAFDHGEILHDYVRILGAV